MNFYDKDRYDDSPKKKIDKKQKAHKCKDPAMNVLISAGIVPESGKTSRKKRHSKHYDDDFYGY